MCSRKLLPIPSLVGVEVTEDVHAKHQPSATTESLQEKVKAIQRTRHLLLWHDHATLLGSGYILITLTILYDSAVFLTTAEYTTPTERLNVCERIEKPQIYLITRGTSSISDHLALIGDRVDCLHTLPTKLTTSNGIKVVDHMLFFCGDKPAQNFERGTQMGGNFKLGAVESGAVWWKTKRTVFANQDSGPTGET